MPLPKVFIQITEPTINGSGTEANINATVHVIAPGGLSGGGVGVTYTGAENLQQLKSALVSAALALAAGQGHNLTANDVIIMGFEKG